MLENKTSYLPWKIILLKLLFQVKAILLKHLESAPKEILGDFPRLSREGAILMINNTARSLAQGQDAANQKIPSLFELNLSAPMDKNDEKDDKGNLRKKSRNVFFIKVTLATTLRFSLYPYKLILALISILRLKIKLFN